MGDDTNRTGPRESVLLTFTLEEDAYNYWRAWLRAPGIERYPLTAGNKTKDGAFMELVERLSISRSR